MSNFQGNQIEERFKIETSDYIAGAEDEDPTSLVPSFNKDTALGETDEHLQTLSHSEIWIIDCRNELFENVSKTEGEYKYWWKEVMQAALENMKRMIIAQPRSKFGIILFNTTYFLNDMGVPNVYVILSYDKIDPKRIQKVLFESNLTKNDFISKYGGVEENNVSFSDLLWVVNNILVKKLNYSKVTQGCSITFFTTSDDPCHSQQERITAIKRAQDLRENFAETLLIYLDMPGRVFDISKFYIDILGIDYDRLDEFRDFSHLRLEHFKERIRRKDVTRSSVFTNTLYLTPNVSFDVKVLIQIYSQRVPTPTYVDTQDFKPIRKEYVWKIEGTEEEVDPADIIYTIKYGDKEIEISSNKLTELKRQDTPHMTLIGFVPISWIKMHYSISHTYFLIPDDTHKASSSAMFSALHQTMFLNQKAAIVDWLPRKGSLLRRAALLSQMEKFNEAGDLVELAGFVAIKLPFFEEMRRIPIEYSRVKHIKDEETESQEHLKTQEHAKNLLSCYFDENYHPDKYSNPQLQQHYAELEAAALDMDEPDIPDNVFVNDDRDNDDHIQQLVEKWTESFKAEATELRLQDPEEYTINNEQDAHKNFTQKDAKRAKTQISVSIYDAKILYKEDNLSKLTVSQLKEILGILSINSGGLKSQLIDRLKEYLESNKDTQI